MTQICSLLLAKMNGNDGESTFIDSSSYGRQIISKNATTSVTKSKFNGSSGFFNGNANLSVTSGDWTISKDEDFTIESWVLFNTLPLEVGTNPASAPYATIFYLKSATETLQVYVRWVSNPENPSENKAAFVCYYSDSSKNKTLTLIPETIPGLSSLATDQWYHVSVTKSVINNSVVLRVNGQTNLGGTDTSNVELTAEDSPEYKITSQSTILIGSELDGEQVKSETGLIGYLADLRIIKKSIYPFNIDFARTPADFFLFPYGGEYIAPPTAELTDCVSKNSWYNLQDLVKPSICLCVDDGMQANRSPTPILYESEAQCMNEECPIPPITCNMTISGVTFLGCEGGNAKFLIETAYPEYDTMIQIKVGDGNFEDVEKYNGSSATISVPIPQEPATFRLYKYVCEDQRCFISWPSLPYDAPAPLTPMVELKSVRYDQGDLMKVTGLKYKYVSPFYLPGSTPPLLGDYGEVHGGTLSDSTRDPVVGDIVRIEPEAGNNSAISAVYRIVSIDNPTNEETRIITLECANYLCDDVKQNMVGWTVETIYVHNYEEVDCVPGEDAGKPTIVNVKVASVPNKGTRFVFNNKYESPFFMTRGTYYRFDVSDSTNSSDSIAFSTSPDGNPNGPISPVSIVVSGTPGTSGAYIDIFSKDLSDDLVGLGSPFKADGNTQEFYYYSTNNANRGGKITLATKTPGDGDEDSDLAAVPAPCGSGHTCDRTKFDITINGVLVLKSNLNNVADTTSKPSTKFGGNWSPLPSGIGENRYDRRCVTTITQEMNDQIFASASSDSDSDGLGDKGGCECAAPGDETGPTSPFVLGITPSEGNNNPHSGVTWVRMKNRCSQTVYSCCIGLSFCPDCPPPDPC